MTELKHKLKDKFKIELSRFHINRIITDNNITLKITRIRHEPEKRFGKDININQKLKEFYDEINPKAIKGGINNNQMIVVEDVDEEEEYSNS